MASGFTPEQQAEYNKIYGVPPTNDPGRWVRATDGSFYEAKMYNGPRSPLPSNYVSHNADSNGSKYYYDSNQKPPSSQVQYTEENYNAKKSAGYDDELTDQVLAAYGKSQTGLLPDPMRRQLASNPATRAAAKRRPNETTDMWFKRLSNLLPGGFYQDKSGKWVAQGLNLDQGAKDYINFETARDPNGMNLGERQEADKIKKEAATKQVIDDFIKEMNTPLDANHPEVQRLMSQVNTATERQASLRGIEGPLSLANTQQASINALSDTNFQRKNAAIDAAKYREQSDVAAGREKYQRGLDTYGQQYQGWQDKMGVEDMYKPSYNAAASGQGIGGGIGSMIGGLAGSFIPGIGTAGGAALGGAIGGGIGGGIGANEDDNNRRGLGGL